MRTAKDFVFRLIKKMKTGEYDFLEENELKDLDYDYLAMADIIVQWTGLLDKNGKKIFEGDIVQGRKPCRESYRMGVVEYKPMVFVINCQGEKIKKLHGIEVIGNIYQHPELLKGGAE